MLIETPEITAPAVTQFVRELDGFAWLTRYEACRTCSEPTTWVDLAFERPVHPGKCSEQLWDDYAWGEMFAYLKSPEYREMVDSFRAVAMRCPNKSCHPPRYCGLCKGTGKIPD